MSFFAAVTIFISSRSCFFLPNYYRPLDVTKNLRAWILQLFRLVDVFWLAFDGITSAESASAHRTAK
jgi:hypothetical protein